MIVQFHTDNAVEYKFDDEAEKAMKNERDVFTGDINDAINDGFFYPFYETFIFKITSPTNS